MNLVEGIQKQCDRCREGRKAYESIGAPGVIGIAIIDDAIAEGEASIASGDVVRMVRAYDELESIQV